MSYEVLARPLRVAILTVSDTRTFETDKGGNKVQEFLEQADHIVADRKIVIDDYNEIRNAMIPWCNDESIDVTFFLLDRKSTRLNSSHITRSRMPSSA